MIITKNILFKNLIFDCKFDASGGNPIFKKKNRQFTINFSQKLVKEENKDLNFLEKELKNWQKPK